MKKIRFIVVAGVIFSLVLGGCKKKESPAVFPDNLKVDVSSAISFPDLDKKKGLILSDSIISGNDLYQNLRSLVYISDFSAGMIQNALNFVRSQSITKPVSFSYIGADDQMEKTLVFTDQYLYRKEVWDYGLLITDAKMGNAFLMVWNLSPLKVIAILHPVAYNYNTEKQRNAYLKVEYGEDNPKYDKTMIVSAINLDSTDARYVKRMKVFFGQKGDVVSLYGNFNMPYAYVLSALEPRGRSWSFKAKNNVKEDIAVALCGLPKLTVDTVDKIWSDYSMEKVLKRQLMVLFPSMLDQDADALVSDAKGVAYLMGQQGFVANDADNPDPAKFTSSFIDMSDINPWAPAIIETLNVDF